MAIEKKVQISVLITETARELLVGHAAGKQAIGYELDRLIKAAYGPRTAKQPEVTKQYGLVEDLIKRSGN